jgi:hypothetical protein
MQVKELLGYETFIFLFAANELQSQLEGMMEDRLPKRSYELIRVLDEMTAYPKLPESQRGWHNMDEATMRSLAYAAGARDFVTRLVATMNWEIEQDERGDTEHHNVSTGGSGSGFEAVAGDLVAREQPRSRVDGPATE